MRKTAFLLLLTLLTACVSKTIVWTENHNFSGNEWKGREEVTFVPDTVSLLPGDTERGVLTFRYSSNANVRSFPVIMEIECPQTGEYRIDTLRTSLLSTAERTGNRSSAGVFEANDTITLNLPVDPGWTVTFRLPDPNTEIKGLFSLMFTLER